MTDFVVRTHPRGRHQEPALTVEVFTTMADAKLYLATYIELKKGKLTKGGRTGSYYDPNRECYMRLFIEKRLE